MANTVLSCEEHVWQWSQLPPVSPPGRIADLSDLVQRRDRILGVVEREADELVAKFGTPRRTALIADGAWGGKALTGSTGAGGRVPHAALCAAG